MADEKKIKQVLRKLEYGVYIVTMGKGEDGNAFTGSWIMQVSSEPLMVAIAIHNKHQSARLLKEHDSYVVNLLPDSALNTAKAYFGPAESGYDKLKAKDVKDSPGTGTPILNGALGYIDCRIVNRVQTGNHTLYIGEVVEANLDADNPIMTTSNSRLHYTG